MKTEGDEMQDLKEAAARDAADLDSTVGKWQAGYAASGGKIFCGKGCSGCCTLAVNCTLTEALRVAEVLTEPQKERVVEQGRKMLELVPAAEGLKEYLRMHRVELGPCPLLEPDGFCGVYAVRPLSCRALLSTRESVWCSTDFGKLTADERRRFVESLVPEAAAPTHYAAATQQRALELEEAAERLMKERFGFTVSGNLRYLLFMEVAFGIGKIVPKGFDSTATFLFTEGLLLPFVLDLK